MRICYSPIHLIIKNVPDFFNCLLAEQLLKKLIAEIKWNHVGAITNPSARTVAAGCSPNYHPSIVACFGNSHTMAPLMNMFFAEHWLMINWQTLVLSRQQCINQTELRVHTQCREKGGWDDTPSRNTDKAAAQSPTWTCKTCLSFWTKEWKILPNLWVMILSLLIREWTNAALICLLLPPLGSSKKEPGVTKTSLPCMLHEVLIYMWLSNFKSESNKPIPSPSPRSCAWNYSDRDLSSTLHEIRMYTVQNDELIVNSSLKQCRQFGKVQWVVSVSRSVS